MGSQVFPQVMNKEQLKLAHYKQEHSHNNTSNENDNTNNNDNYNHTYNNINTRKHAPFTNKQEMS